MPVTFANLGNSTGTTEQAPDIRDVGDAIAYTIPSWSPPGDGIVVLCVASGENAGQIGILSVTGNGDPWVQIGGVQYPAASPTRDLDIWAAYGADLVAGVTTIDFDPSTQIFCYVSIFHIQGALQIPGNVASAFDQLITGTGTGTGTGVIALEPQVSPGGRALAFVLHSANEAITNDPGYTNLDDMNGAGPAIGMLTAYDPDGVTDPEFTWATSIAFGWVAGEILEAASSESTYMKAGLGIVS